MATCNNKRTLSKGLRIALIILGAFALLYVIGMAYSSWTNKRFEQNGVRTFATVTDVQVKHHPEHTSWVTAPAAKSIIRPIPKQLFSTHTAWKV